MRDLGSALPPGRSARTDNDRREEAVTWLLAGLFGVLSAVVVARVESRGNMWLASFGTRVLSLLLSGSVLGYVGWASPGRWSLVATAMLPLYDGINAPPYEGSRLAYVLDRTSWYALSWAAAACGAHAASLARRGEWRRLRNRAETAGIVLAAFALGFVSGGIPLALTYVPGLGTYAPWILLTGWPGGSALSAFYVAGLRRAALWTTATAVELGLITALVLDVPLRAYLGLPEENLWPVALALAVLITTSAIALGALVRRVLARQSGANESGSR